MIPGKIAHRVPRQLCHGQFPLHNPLPKFPWRILNFLAGEVVRGIIVIGDCCLGGSCLLWSSCGWGIVWVGIL